VKAIARIETICVGLPRTVRHDGKDVETGIFKAPVAGRVQVHETGIEGDGQADLRVHGGRDKAVYVYAQDHYARWAEELGRTPEPSWFGENLTVSGLTEDVIRVGDRVRFGGITAIVAQPRIPCYKLGIRMGDDGFPAVFTQRGRPGVYLRIEKAGKTGAGDAFEVIDEAVHGITVATLWRLVFGRDKPADARALAARCLEFMPHLDAGWQRRLGLLTR